MKHLRLGFVAIALLLGVVLGLPFFPVRATESSPVISIVDPPTQDSQAINAVVQDIQLWVVEKEIFKDKTTVYMSVETNGNVLNIRVNTARYKDLSQKKKQDVMQYALDAIVNSNISRTNKNKIYNEFSSFDSSTASLVRSLSSDVNADFYGAYRLFRPFSGVLGTILGCAALGIFVILGISIVTDLAFMTLPIVTNLLMAKDGGSAKFVSIEAVSAVKESMSLVGSPDFKGPLGFYMKTKTKQFIAITICLLYLVSGQLYNVIASVMDSFNAFIGIYK